MIQDAPQEPAAPLTEAADTVALTFGDWLRSTIGMSLDTQVKLVSSLVAVLAVWLLRRLILRVVEDRLERTEARYRWSKISSYVAFVLAILIVSQIWLEALRSLGTFLGLLSAGLAIALRDPVADLAGWGFILWRSPFELGHRIQIGEHVGDVVDIRIFQFTILEVGNWVDADQSTGRVIHVPNARLFTDPLANYTAEFEYIWNEVSVLLTFESDWKRAKELLEEIVEEVAGDMVDEARKKVRRASRKYLIHYQHVTPIVYTTVKDSGVLLAVRYLCEARSRRGTEEGIWERVLDAFDGEPAIDFAYPTRRVFHNLLEGKTDARAEPPGWLADRAPERSDDGE